MSGDSESLTGAQKLNGSKNIRALIEETNKSLAELGSEELRKRLVQMKTALEQVKRGIRHPSAKLKPSNIITPDTYEQAEIKDY